MILKKFISMCFALILLFCFTINCFADSDSYKKNKYLYEEEEHQKVVSSNKSFLHSEEPNSSISLSCKMYAIYYNDKTIDELKSGVFLDQLVEDIDYWHLTLKDNTYITALKESDDKYHAIEVGPYPTEDNQLEILNFDKIEEKISSLGVAIDDDKLIVKMIYSISHYLTRDDRQIYIRYEDKEYIIPYGPFIENYGGLNTGQIYTMEEWVNFLEERNNIIKKTSEQIKKENTKKEIEKFLPYIITGGCALIIASTVIIFLVIRKIKTQ